MCIIIHKVRLTIFVIIFLFSPQVALSGFNSLLDRTFLFHRKPFTLNTKPTPEPLPIGNHSLKSFLTHSHTKPLLTHYTLIVFVAPFNISLIKQSVGSLYFIVRLFSTLHNLESASLKVQHFLQSIFYPSVPTES